MSQESHPFVFAANAPLSALEKELDAAWQKDEAEHVRFLLDQVPLDDQQRSSVKSRAADLVARVRARSSREAGVMEAFMREYDLASEEGVILMCLAEALLRIPDSHTAEALISDKLSDADWEAHLGKSSSVLVNAGTWGLMLTGRLVGVRDSEKGSIGSLLSRMAGRSGEPVICIADREAVFILGFE